MTAPLQRRPMSSTALWNFTQSDGPEGMCLF
jgi:hypothetical protein